MLAGLGDSLTGSHRERLSDGMGVLILILGLLEDEGAGDGGWVMRPASDLSPQGARLAGLRQEAPMAGGGLRKVAFSQAAPALPPHSPPSPPPFGLAALRSPGRGVWLRARA